MARRWASGFKKRIRQVNFFQKSEGGVTAANSADSSKGAQKLLAAMHQFVVCKLSVKAEEKEVKEREQGLDRVNKHT